jgi:hypothetical protein
MVSSQGIEVDPNKLKAIQVILAPKTRKKNFKRVLGSFKLYWLVYASNDSNL